jgi:hypothetical protein
LSAGGITFPLHPGAANDVLGLSGVTGFDVTVREI